MSIAVVPELTSWVLASWVLASWVLDPLELLELLPLLPLLSDASLAGDPPGPANDVTCPPPGEHARMAATTASGVRMRAESYPLPPHADSSPDLPRAPDRNTAPNVYFGLVVLRVETGHRPLHRFTLEGIIGAVSGVLGVREIYTGTRAVPDDATGRDSKCGYY